MADASTQQVNVGDLNLSQLSDVKKQLEEELNHFTSSFAQLKSAQVKFKQCIGNVGELSQSKCQSKSVLVPLTNSLYVPGKIYDTDSVVVDIGTGYYVRKARLIFPEQLHPSYPDAIKHYNGKVDFLNGNLAKLDEKVGKKRENMEMLVQLMQKKLQEETQAVKS